MGIAMNFPTCWDDSKGLGDTGDHMSHMAYTVDGTVEGACPSGYNRRLPQIQLFVRISNYEGGKYTFSDNTLASDTEVFHADFMNGWEQGVLENIVDNCQPVPGTQPGDFNPPCNCDSFLTRKSTMLSLDYESPGRNDAEAAAVCPIDITDHIVDEEINFSVGGLPRGSCSAPIIENVAPTFVDECGLRFTENTFDEENCNVVPTARPSLRPTPRLTPSPPSSPVTAQPTLGATPRPTPISTEEEEDDEEEGCLDDESFRLNGKSGKTCDWIGERKGRMNKQCRKRAVKVACPETCGRCSTEPSPVTTRPTLRATPRPTPIPTDADDEDEDEVDDESEDEDEDEDEDEGEGEDEDEEEEEDEGEDEDEDEEEGECLDDESFRLNGNDGKTCDWIGEKQGRKNKQCRRRAVKIACAETCGECL